MLYIDHKKLSFVQIYEEGIRPKDRERQRETERQREYISQHH